MYVYVNQQDVENFICECLRCSSDELPPITYVMPDQQYILDHKSKPVDDFVNGFPEVTIKIEKCNIIILNTPYIIFWMNNIGLVVNKNSAQIEKFREKFEQLFLNYKRLGKLNVLFDS